MPVVGRLLTLIQETTANVRKDGHQDEERIILYSGAFFVVRSVLLNTQGNGCTMMNAERLRVAIRFG